MPAPHTSPRYFSIDVEGFASDFPEDSSYELRVEAPLNRLLALLEAHGSRATLFFLVEPARRHPELVRRALAAGHRIGLHGLDHQLVYRQQPSRFCENLRAGRKALEDLTGTPITTYRAPCWSITRASLWAIDALREAGFEVDSSVFPTRNHLYGIAEAPSEPYLLADGIVEIPPSVLKVGAGLNIPFLGGFYLRALPMPATRLLARQALRAGRHLLAYVHPWEIDADQPRDLPYTSWVGRTIHYHNLPSTSARLEAVLKAFGPFEPLPQTFAEAAPLVRSAFRLVPDDGLSRRAASA